MKLLLALSVIVAAMVVTSTANAGHRHFVVPQWFRAQAECIHSHEAPTWRWSPYYHPGYSYWNGYYTGMQFAPSTWQRANELLHLHTNPATASKLSVMLHALAIYRGDGDSWREWNPDPYLCGF